MPVSSGDAIFHDGYFRIVEGSAMTLRARAFDSESSIKTIWVAIGSSRGRLSIIPMILKFE